MVGGTSGRGKVAGDKFSGDKCRDSEESTFQNNNNNKEMFRPATPCCCG